MTLSFLMIVIISSMGIGLFMYGKKLSLGVPRIIGVIFMFTPYVVSGGYFLIAVALTGCAAVYYMKF